MKPKTTAQKIVAFNDMLKNTSINLPGKYRLINPFAGTHQQQIMQIRVGFTVNTIMTTGGDL